jgi:hypothetical protein
MIGQTQAAGILCSCSFVKGGNEGVLLDMQKHIRYIVVIIEGSSI